MHCSLLSFEMKFVIAWTSLSQIMQMSSGSHSLSHTLTYRIQYECKTFVNCEQFKVQMQIHCTSIHFHCNLICIWYLFGLKRYVYMNLRSHTCICHSKYHYDYVKSILSQGFRLTSAYSLKHCLNFEAEWLQHINNTDRLNWFKRKIKDFY